MTPIKGPFDWMPMSDGVPMTKDEIFRRRSEGRMMHKFGDRLLAISFFGGMPFVMVGNPEQKVVIGVES